MSSDSFVGRATEKRTLFAVVAAASDRRPSLVVLLVFHIFMLPYFQYFRVYVRTYFPRRRVFRAATSIDVLANWDKYTAKQDGDAIRRLIGTIGVSSPLSSVRKAFISIRDAEEESVRMESVTRYIHTYPACHGILVSPLFLRWCFVFLMKLAASCRVS